MSTKKGTNDNVRVMVRVRPFNNKEITEAFGNPTCTLACNSDSLISCIDPSNPSVESVFPFDYIFWSMPDSQVKAGVPESDQADVYKIVGVPQLDSMFEGYNGCIFAYGQTSSGVLSFILQLLISLSREDPHDDGHRGGRSGCDSKVVRGVVCADSTKGVSP